MSVLLAALFALLPQWFEREPLQPYEARSASGAWTLEVKPSDPSGKGPMHARILHAKEVSWSGDLPWTFEKAGVAEDGTCVGYANGKDELRVAVIDAKGAVRKDHAIKHTAWIVDGPALPTASGPVLVLPGADAAWIRIHPADQSSPPPWRTFRLSTGEAGPDVQPEKPAKLAEREDVYERDVAVVGDTGLVLVHWWYANYAPGDLDWSQDGGIFALHDVTGRVVWRSLLLDDYTDTTSEKADDALEGSLRDGPFILTAGPGHRFVVRHVKENARVEYAVEKDASGSWNVKEVGRTPWTDGIPQASTASIEAITLVERGRVPLQAGSKRAKQAIHDVLDLAVTEAGELELIRREDGPGLSYARLKQDGTVVFERDLTASMPRKDAWPQFTKLTGDRWLLRFSDDELPCLVLNVRTGVTTPAPLPKGALNLHVAAFPGGGYVAVVPQVVRSLALTELYRVGADGAVVWMKHVSSYGDDDDALHKAVGFAHGVARTGETTFAILGMSDITRVDLDQNVLGVWELEALLGHRAGYMSGILADGKGGLIFEEGDAFHHLDAAGKEIGTFSPKRSDGSREGSMDAELCVAPDGRIWTTDGQRLYRLDEHGVADLALGAEPKDDELSRIGACAIDELGRVLVQDEATHAVHVFDAEGKRAALCKLAPKERPEGWESEPFRGTKDGSVWVFTQDGFAHFDGTGTRLPSSKTDPAADPKRLRFRDPSEELDRADPARAALNSMKLRPDGSWLAHVEARACLPDGRRVVLEGPGRDGDEAALHLYTSKGEPIRSFSFPAEGWQRVLSVGPRWLVVDEPGGSGFTLLRLADEKLLRFTMKDEHGAFGQTPDGKTLLVLDSKKLELVRYEFP